MFSRKTNYREPIKISQNALMKTLLKKNSFCVTIKYQFKTANKYLGRAIFNK